MKRILLVMLLLLTLASFWYIGRDPARPATNEPGEGAGSGKVSQRVRAQIGQAAPGDRFRVQVTLRYDAAISREQFVHKHRAIFQDAGVEFMPSYLMFSASLTREQIELLGSLDEVYGITAPDEYAVP
ncbi:MAG: hypothetical protein ACOY93_23280 [Bacillota bacterium]